MPQLVGNIKSSPLTVVKVQKAFKRMSRLRLFNVCNMPEIEDPDDPTPPVDYTLNSSAALLVDTVNSGMPQGLPHQLHTLVIGASLYKDVKIGASEFPGNALADFLQFRVYHVDHSYQTPVGRSTVVSLMAKGTTSEMRNLGIRDFPKWLYWLT